MENHKELGKIMKFLYIRYIEELKECKNKKSLKSSRTYKILKNIDNLNNLLYIALLEEEYNGFNKKRLDNVYSSSIQTAFKLFISKDYIIDMMNKAQYMQLYNEFNIYLNDNKIININKEDFMVLVSISKTGGT